MTNKMLNEMNILIAPTSNTLPYSSPPVIGSVINFLQPWNSEYVIMSNTKFCDTNATQYVFV